MSIPLQLTLSDTKKFYDLSSKHEFNSLGDRPISMSAVDLTNLISLKNQISENVDYSKFNVSSVEYQKSFTQAMLDMTDMNLESVQMEFDYHLKILSEDFGCIELLESYPKLEVQQIIESWD